MILTRQIVLILSLILLPAAAHAQDGWYLFRADAQRSNAVTKAANWDKRVPWQRPLLMDKLDGLPELDDEQAAKDLIYDLYKNADKAILPASFPLIVKGTCVIRSYSGVRCVALRPAEARDEETNTVEPIPPSEFLWKSIPHLNSIALLLQKHETKGPTNSVVKILRDNKQEQFAWANEVIGSSSSDGITIFALNDFAFPVVDFERNPYLSGFYKLHAIGNSIWAYDALSGKLQWDTHGEYGEKSQFRQTFFLGAPLPVEGRLFALNEKGEDLRLLTIELDSVKSKRAQYLKPKIDKSLTIATIPAKEQILKHPLRRAQALHIAQAGDLLICPTNAGTLVGVDRAKFAVRWTYRYREEGTPAPALPLWQAACPVVSKDRIVFTAADAAPIHCLDLDGKQRWVAKADKDLYLAAVHADLVLLVGKTHCRALSLADGSEKWRLETGLPAGVGVRDGELFYLPLREEAGTMKPAIWAIDLAKGTKAHRLAVPYPDALGNLALHRGLFVSQSVTHIAAFPLSLLPPK